MNHDTLHSRITAYALGELSGTDKEELENLLHQQPELQSELEEIRNIGALLTEALRQEPIRETPITPLTTQKSWTFLLKITTVAATLLFLAGGLFFLNPSSSKEKQLSQNATTPLSPFSAQPSVPAEESLQEKETICVEMADFEAEEYKPTEVLEDTSSILLEAPSSVEERTPPVDSGVMATAGESAMPSSAPPAPSVRRNRSGENRKLSSEFHLQDSHLPQPRAAAAVAEEKALSMPEPYPVKMDVQRDEAPLSSRSFVKEPVRRSNRNSYSGRKENVFQSPSEVPFSTFGVDVDTTSYTLARQYLTEQRELPPPEAIRVEEFLQYFDYDFPQPTPDASCPIAATVEIHPHPWQEGLLMAQVSLQGREIPREKRPPLNLVFLLDVSGSMSDWNKLPLVKDGMMKLLDQLTEGDRIAIVTYANDARVHLPATSGLERPTLEKAILQLSASGGTAGSRGLELAYEVARKNFNKEGANRVILCSDGDFNIGKTDNKELEKQIAHEAQSGIFLTVLGFGMGNYHDDRLKNLASHGNGNYGYVDSRSEAQRLLCDEFCGTLLTIAKDVKLQIEFNPQHIAAYRLIGFEHRHLEARDFHDDRKDSGEIGAGHSVTALYELVPHGIAIPSMGKIDTPRYAAEESKAQEEVKPVDTQARSPEWMFVKIRYKLPEEKESSLVEIPFTYSPESKTEPGRNFRLATSATLFGLLLRQSEYTADANWNTVQKLLADVPPGNAREQELVKLVKLAQELDSANSSH